MFSDFIKHYNIIRTILRDIFLYGCFSREGLEEKRNISSRKLSYEMRRIQQYIEDEYIRIDKDGRCKLLALTYDSIRNTENFLIKTYMTKSFTRTDLILYFYILGNLHMQDKSCCFRELEDLLIENELISYDNISRKTIERKLNEMYENLGILQCDTVKRVKHYSIAKDIFKALDNQELTELFTAVSLFKNILFPVSAGYYCESSLKDYIVYERDMKLDFKDYFQYRNVHFHPVIEEEILWQILKVIHGKICISLNYKLPQSSDVEIPKQILKPYKVRYDIQCGRFYLVSYDEYDRCIISRLDRIESIDIHKESYEAEGLEKLYKSDMSCSWSSVPLVRGNKRENIKIEIFINEPKENYIIEKIKGEVHGAAVERIDKGYYLLTMSVNDSSEMVPWIRSYSGYMKVIEGRHLVKKLSEDWREMLENYGVV
ncbi:WYL domain-containing protein [Clostridium sp. PL3]|uniref:WYL domain-containing protein n=1 Tax=Clostridium thailandense TaxID=2794346 RepID=A0A949TY47_9CLOT|nr:WYL domain-containing protein [Clostridium thailandense]MBV7274733.1 WYL domain-containing protein [Clostridium thailandense]